MRFLAFLKGVCRVKSISFLTFMIVLTAFGCEKFYDTDLGNGIKTDDYYADQSEFRAAAMGLYALQQDLVEQLVILGELRGDLMKITDYANEDLREIYNFDVSPTNRYASPRGFYRLIGACNKFISQIEQKVPQVLDKSAPIDNYDRYYGEALCMRAWAYFNAARIYGKIPYIPSSMQDLNSIQEYVNSPKTVIDTFEIIYAPDGYYNDTIRRDTSYVIDNAFLDINSIIDTLTHQLETKIKAVGVNHRVINGDITWDITTWTNYSMNVLLGQMYLTIGDLAMARSHFHPILYNYDTGFGDVRFGLDKTFKNTNWKKILTSINPNEHIYTIKFNKADQQQHQLQYLFSNISPNSYQLKPSGRAVFYWETIWDGFWLIPDPNNPSLMVLDTARTGKPGDYYRGINVSYGYFKGTEPLNNDEVAEMLEYKRVGSYLDVEEMMDGADTVITKYSLDKNPFSWDADFILYRAAGVHLYAAEITANQYRLEGTFVVPSISLSERFLNDGSYQSNELQLGVRGRVGFSDVDPRWGYIVGFEYITTGRGRIYTRDPYSNKVTGFINPESIAEKQIYLENQIMEERARELAYEGERFYDLMRVAKRRQDNSFLADKVAAKFTGGEAARIREHLMIEENWYLPFYIGTEADDIQTNTN